MNGMKRLDVYWHIYPRDQIKPELRGNLIYLLEIPALPGAPVVRQIVDPRGLDFPKRVSENCQQNVGADVRRRISGHERLVFRLLTWGPTSFQTRADHPRFPAPPLWSAAHHAILYQGVSKAAADDRMLLDPSIQRADPRFAFYNRDLICNSRQFFLVDPQYGFETMPEHTVRLLCGQTVILDKLLPQRKYVAVV